MAKRTSRVVRGAGGIEMRRNRLVLLGAWIAWLAGCVAGLRVLAYTFEESKASTLYLIQHRGEDLFYYMAGAVAGGVALGAFLHLARWRKVRLGPPGEQERFAVGCYAVFLILMVWVVINTLALR